MKLAASYNFFNGEEHLLASLRVHRPVIDVISVVWQEISNAGEPISQRARRVIKAALQEGLIDELIAYTPDLSLPRKTNETRKRQIGLSAAREAGATHFLSLDADEFYRPDEMVAAKREIARQGWQSTSVNSFLHIRRPIWRALDRTCCCFITEIGPATEIGVKSFPQADVDPSRRMSAQPETHHHFPADQVAMYHMNLVRHSLEGKLRNSSTMNQKFLAKVHQMWRDWQPGDPFHIPHKPPLFPEEVANEFMTFDPEASDYKLYQEDLIP